MAEQRRTLIEGMQVGVSDDASSSAATAKERDFVFKHRPKQTTATVTIGRTPLTTRLRDDYAKAIKRASLERQLNGTEPNTLQDLMEEAIEAWLRTNGYSP